MATAWKWIKPLLMVIVAFAGWQLFRGTAFPQIALGFAIVGALHCVATLALASINRTSRGARRTLNSWLRATLVVAEAVLGWAVCTLASVFALGCILTMLLSWLGFFLWIPVGILSALYFAFCFVNIASERIHGAE